MSSKNKPKNSSRKVWFIKNTTTEGPGYLAQLLKKRKIQFSICDLQKGDSLPVIRNQDVVIVLGGPMSANDKTPSMRALLKWIRPLLKRKIPYLGICLGLQTLVKAAGGRVVKNSVKEIGLLMPNRRPFFCDLTKQGMADPLFSQFKNRFPIFQLHGETVVLKKGMVLLAQGDTCRNQVVRVGGNAYGFQGHLEMTTKLLSEWLVTDDDLKTKNAKALMRQWISVKKELHEHCERSFFNFLKIAKVVK